MTTTHGDHWLNNAIDVYWRKYRKCLKNCQQSASEEAVHKLRIANRRLLALIDLLDSLGDRPILHKAHQQLKKQLNGLDELRDTQVMRLKVSDTVSLHPDLLPFLHHLHVQEQRLLMQAPTLLRLLSQQKLRRKLTKARRYYRLPARDLCNGNLTIIDPLYRQVLARYQAVDPAQPGTLHRLRTALKKLRYTLLLAQPLLPETTPLPLADMQRYLTHLGDIQNATVLLHSFDAFFKEQTSISARVLFQAEQQQLIAEFMPKMDELTTFWHID